jgi:hypothetical protein
MKKLISIVLIFSLLPYLTGCYTIQQVNLEEIKESNSIKELTVHTRDSVSYRFNKGNFSFKSDSLSGTGTRIIDRKEISFSGNIALKDILKIDPEKQNADKNLQGDIVVHTRNMYTYAFDEGDYLFKADTLYGEGDQLSLHSENPFSGELALSDITGLDAYKYDGGRTATSVIIATLFFGLIALGYAMANRNSLDFQY